MKERVPQRWLVESALHSLSTDTAFGISLKRRTSLLTEHEFDLAKLMRLKPAPRFKAIAKRQEVEGRDCFEHVDLRHQCLEDSEHTLERGAGKRRVVRPQALLEIVELVEHFLEPQLIDLMDDHKERLVMLQLT